MTSDSSGKALETGTRRTEVSLSKGFDRLDAAKAKPTATQKRRALKPRKPAVKAEAGAEAER